MKERGLWAPLAATGLALASWLLALSLVGSSTVEATSNDRTAFSNDAAPFAVAPIVAVGAESTDTLCPCRGIWVTQTVDSSEDVGQFTSLALEPAALLALAVLWVDERTR
jgi:hypothetical protein